MKTILYATDCDPKKATALRYAYRISKILKAELHVVHVYDLMPFATAAVRSRGILERNYFKDRHMSLFNYCRERLKYELGSRKPYFHVVRNSSVTRGIAEVVRKINADLVLVGIKSPNTLRGLFTGNIGNELMGVLECPLLILPEDFDYHGLSTLLYATDFEETDFYAIESLVAFAEPYGALIKIIHVPRAKEFNFESKARWFKQTLAQRIDYPEIVFSAERAEDVESGILDHVSKDMPEMLVMMEREHPSFLERFFHRDMVKTMEGEISIPLLVFNKKGIEVKLTEEPTDSLRMQWV